MILQPGIATRLGKVALDNGFDLALMSTEGWLGFASSQAPLRIWLTQGADSHFVAALSQPNVAQALAGFGDECLVTLPSGIHAARNVPDIPTLHHLVRRAFQLSRALPHELLHTFEEETIALPRSTEAERLVIQRVGQDIFRKGLIDYWEGRCAVTGLARIELLRASHIKPWADCTTDAERLDVFNGLLLAPHLDALFDGGFITVTDDGGISMSSLITAEERQILGLVAPLSIYDLMPEHRAYLAWHRERVFRQ
jgi:putative restriction endonuclease